MKKTTNKYCIIFLAFTVFCGILPLYGQDGALAASTRNPIAVNLIIDGSNAYTGVRDEITKWLSGRLDQILANGDRVTVWSAGASAKVIYSGVISGTSEIEAVKKSIQGLTGSGNTADFSSALREAADRQSTGYSYTLLITASPQSITGSSASQLRYSRVEEFTNWRALVVGLNLDNKVKRAANSFFGS